MVEADPEIGVPPRVEGLPKTAAKRTRLSENLAKLLRECPVLWIVDDCQTVESASIAQIFAYLFERCMMLHMV
jgi:hypothetical protein